jgi:putative flavoprotein involved in K+ transport
MPESIHTLVVGGGQAGLAVSYCLKMLGVEHLVLEKASQPGYAWRHQRWDSFTLVTPNLSFQIPGAEYRGPDPDGFMSRQEIVQRFEDYVHANSLPVTFDAAVTSVQPEDGAGYRVTASGRVYRARNVVMANGWYHQGKMPAFASKIPGSILQMHSSSYRSPQSLPPGAVLVVGSAQSGAQIAEELYQSGRKVYLCTGACGRLPRRYRGKDVFVWLTEAGFFERSAELFNTLPNHYFVAPQLSGRDGGHTLNLHQFYRDGVTLLGHARDYVDGALVLANDFKENLARSDQGEKNMLENVVDAYIRKAGIDVPEERVPALTDGYQAPEVTSLDLQKAGVASIIWSVGFKYDLSMLPMPVLDEYGYPKADRGASSDYPGLYFIGIPFMPKLKSGFIYGVGENAQFVAEHIAERE